MSNVSEIAIIITARDEATKVLNNFLGTFNKAFKDSVSEFEKIGLIAGGAIAGGLALATNEAALFQNGMAAVNAIVGDTGASLDTLNAIALQFGRDTQFSTLQATEAMTGLAQLGAKTEEEFTNLLNSSGALAVALRYDLAGAAELVKTQLNVFGLEVSDAANVADLLAAAANNSALNAEKLRVALQFAGPAAKSANVGLEETLNIIGVLGDKLPHASKVGTSFRGMISALIAPTGKAASTLAELSNRLGISIDVTKRAGESTEAYRRRVEAAKDTIRNEWSPEVNGATNIIKKLGEANLTSAEAVGIFGKIHGPVIKLLTDESGAIDVLADKMKNADSVMEVQAKLLNTLIGQWRLLFGSMKLFLTQTGTPFLEFFQDVVTYAKNVLNAFINIQNETNGWQKAIDPLIDSLRNLVALFINLNATGDQNKDTAQGLVDIYTLFFSAMATVVQGVTDFIGNLQMLDFQTGLVTKATGLITSGFELFITILRNLGSAAIETGSVLSSFISGTFEERLAIINNLVKSISTTFTSWTSEVTTAIKAFDFSQPIQSLGVILSSTTKFGTALISALAVITAFGKGLSLIPGAVTLIKVPMTLLLGQVKGLTSLLGIAGTTFISFKAIVLGGLLALGIAFASQFISMKSAVGTWVDAVDQKTGLASKKLYSLADAFKDSLSSIGKSVQGLDVAPAFQGVLDIVVNFMYRLHDVVDTGMVTITKLFEGDFIGAINSVPQVFQSVLGVVTNLWLESLGTMVQIVKNYGPAVADGLSSWIDNIGDFGVAFVDALTNMVYEALDFIENLLDGYNYSKLFGAATLDLTNLKDSMINALDKVWTSVLNFIKIIGPKLASTFDTAISTMSTVWDNVLPVLVSGFNTVTLGLSKVIIEAGPSLVTSFFKMIRSAITGLASLLSAGGATTEVNSVSERLAMAFKNSFGIMLTPMGAALKTIFGTILAEVGETISTTLGGITKVISKFASDAYDVVTGKKSLSTAFTEWGLKIGLVTTILGSLMSTNILGWLVGLIPGLSGLSGWFGTLAGFGAETVESLTGVGTAVTVVTTLFSPLALKIAGVTAAVAAFYLAWTNNFLGIKDITRDFLTYLDSVFGTDMTGWIGKTEKQFKLLEPIVEDVFNKIKPYLNEFLAWLDTTFVGDLKDMIAGPNSTWGEAWDMAVESVSSAYATIKDYILQISQYLKENMGGQDGTSFWDGIKEGAAFAWGVIKQTVVDEVIDMISLLNQQWPRIQMEMDIALEQLLSWFVSRWPEISNVMTDAVFYSLDELANKTAEWAVKEIEELLNPYQDTIDWVKSNWGELVKWVTDPIGQIDAYLVRKANEMIDAALLPWRTTIDFLKNTWTTAKQLVMSPLDSITTAIFAWVTPVEDALKLPIKEFLSYIGSVGSELYYAAGDMINEFLEGIGDKIRGAGTLVSKAFEVLSDYFIGNSPPKKGPLSNIDVGGANIGKAWVDGLIGGIKNNISALDPALAEIADKTIGQSPPKSGPLSNIDQGGVNIGAAWIQGIATGVSSNVNSMDSAITQISNGVSSEANVQILGKGFSNLIVKVMQSDSFFGQYQIEDAENFVTSFIESISNNLVQGGNAEVLGKGFNEVITSALNEGWFGSGGVFSNDSIDTVSTNISRWVTNVAQQVSKNSRAASAFKSLGQSMVEGLKDGLSGMSDTINSAMNSAKSASSAMSSSSRTSSRSSSRTTGSSSGYSGSESSGSESNILSALDRYTQAQALLKEAEAARDGNLVALLRQQMGTLEELANLEKSNSFTNSGQSEYDKIFKANDFVFRPNQPPVKFNPNDTLYGVKNGFPGGGQDQTAINIYMGGQVVNNPMDLDKVRTVMSEDMIRAIRTRTGMSANRSVVRR